MSGRLDGLGADEELEHAGHGPAFDGFYSAGCIHELGGELLEGCAEFAVLWHSGAFHDGLADRFVVIREDGGDGAFEKTGDVFAGQFGALPAIDEDFDSLLLDAEAGEFLEAALGEFEREDFLSTDDEDGFGLRNQFGGSLVDQLGEVDNDRLIARGDEIEDAAVVFGSGEFFGGGTVGEQQIELSDGGGDVAPREGLDGLFGEGVLDGAAGLEIERDGEAAGAEIGFHEQGTFSEFGKGGASIQGDGAAAAACLGGEEGVEMGTDEALLAGDGLDSILEV